MDYQAANSSREHFYQGMFNRVKKASRFTFLTGNVLSYDPVFSRDSYFGNLENGGFWLFRPRFFRTGLSQRMFVGRAEEHGDSIIVTGKFRFPKYAFVPRLLVCLLFSVVLLLHFDLSHTLSIAVSVGLYLILYGVEYVTSLHAERDVIRLLSECGAQINIDRKAPVKR